MHLLTTLELSWKQRIGFAIFFSSKVKQDFARKPQIKQWQVWIHPSLTGGRNERWCLLLLADGLQINQLRLLRFPDVWQIFLLISSKKYFHLDNFDYKRIYVIFKNYLVLSWTRIFILQFKCAKGIVVSFVWLYTVNLIVLLNNYVTVCFLMRWINCNLLALCTET